MTLIDQARHLLTCDELRGRLPDEVTAFLREVVKLEPVASAYRTCMKSPSRSSWCVYPRRAENDDDWANLYTLETPHDAG